MTILGSLGVVLTPDTSTKLEQALYPGIGILVGFVLPYLLVLSWYLFRTPYKQRDEARREVQRRKEWRLGLKEAICADINANPGTYLAAISHRLKLMEQPEGKVPIAVLDAVRELTAEGKIVTLSDGMHVRGLDSNGA